MSSRQVTLDNPESLSEDAPDLKRRENDIGPWGVRVILNESATVREQTVLASSLGLVIGRDEALFDELADADEIEMPEAETLMARTRNRERVSGVVVTPGSDAAEESMYDPFPSAETRYQLRWENVEAAVRTLLSGAEYDPDEFALYDLGIHGYALVREVGMGEQDGPGSNEDAVVLIAPDREEVDS